MFYFDELYGKKVLKTDLLNCLDHFFTTRESVIKTKEADFEELVIYNKKKFCDYFNISVENFISPCQTHSANVEKVFADKVDYPETDGVILDNFEQAVFLNFADCTPLILFDKKKNIAAVSHAGWRGTAQKIGVLTVEKMVDEFGCSVENIVAAIGPAISKCCYDVGEDVFHQLNSTIKNNSGLFENINGKVFVDLKGINRQQLLEAGISEVDVCPYCTSCDNDLFFSYRKESATTNRHSAVVKLRKIFS